jgi:hypothetical protein
VQILPEQTSGDSVVAVTNHPGDGVYYPLGVDNYSNSATGVTRYRAGLEAETHRRLVFVLPLPGASTGTGVSSAWSFAAAIT